MKIDEKSMLKSNMVSESSHKESIRIYIQETSQVFSKDNSEDNKPKQVKRRHTENTQNITILCVTGSTAIHS